MVYTMYTTHSAPPPLWDWLSVNTCSASFLHHNTIEKNCALYHNSFQSVVPLLQPPHKLFNILSALSTTSHRSPGESLYSTKTGDMGFFSYRVPEPWATPLYRQETSFNSGRKGEKLFVGEAHFQILQNQFSPLIKIPSACPASVPLTVRGVVSDKGAGSSFSRQMLTLSIKCSGNLWGCKDFRQQIPNVEGGNVPCALDRHSGVRQKARVLSLILSQTRCQSLRLQRT